jgi:hypothetical protein
MQFLCALVPGDRSNSSQIAAAKALDDIVPDMQQEPEAALKHRWPWSLPQKAPQVVNVSALEKLSYCLKPKPAACHNGQQIPDQQLGGQGCNAALDAP